MRQVHRAGEKVFVDYSGARASYIDPNTGEMPQYDVPFRRIPPLHGRAAVRYDLAQELRSKP